MSRITAGGGKDDWPYVTGDRGKNRVRVFHRGEKIWIDVHSDEGRVRQRLRINGTPINSRKRARERALQIAAELLSQSLGEVVSTMNGPPRKTMQDLAPKHRRMVENDDGIGEGHRIRLANVGDRLADIIGRDYAVRSLTRDTILEKIKTWADAKGRKARTRRTYQEVALKMMQIARKEGWLPEGSDADDITPIPQKSARNQSYSSDEVRRLLEVAKTIDPRLEPFIHIAVDTGRRANAILQLHHSDIIFETVGEEDLMMLNFREEYDKRSKPGMPMVTRATSDSIRQFQKKAGKSRWLFPDDSDKRWSYNDALSAFRDVEIAAAVPHIPNRGFHGLKRRGVTDMVTAHGYAFASLQSGTSIKVLETHYVEAHAKGLLAGIRALEKHRNE